MKYSPQVLVTGGTGFLGSALVRRLVREGQSVRVLDNNWRGLASRLADVKDQIELIEADIRDAAAVKRAVEGVETIWHLACVNGTEHFYQYPDLVLDTGIRGTINLIDAIKGDANLYFASSSEVYQTPAAIPTDESAAATIPDLLNPRYSYAGAKLAGELMALHWAARQVGRVIVFRPHNVYGPDMGTEHVVPQLILRMADLAQRTRGTIDLPIEGAGDETRAFTHIDDFIDALMLIAQRGQHRSIYHVGSDVETNVLTLAQQIADCFNRQMRVVPGALKEGSVRRRCPDIAKLRRLGFEPRVSLRQGLEQTVRWYRDNFDGYRGAGRRQDRDAA